MKPVSIQLNHYYSQFKPWTDLSLHLNIISWRSLSKRSWFDLHAFECASY